MFKAIKATDRVSTGANQVATATLRKHFPEVKFTFSKSPRKGGLEMWWYRAIGVEATDELCEKIDTFIAENEVFSSWSRYMSRDGSTTGFQIIVDPADPFGENEEAAEETEESEE